ncbi:MAG: hypothetical protein ACXV7C_07825, partial [Candidatus Angelobacter sp.]
MRPERHESDRIPGRGRKNAGAAKGPCFYDGIAKQGPQGKTRVNPAEILINSDQMSFPVTRLRRMRQTDSLRSLVRETRLTPTGFIYPLFVCP